MGDFVGSGWVVAGGGLDGYNRFNGHPEPRSERVQVGTPLLGV